MQPQYRIVERDNELNEGESVCTTTETIGEALSAEQSKEIQQGKEVVRLSLHVSPELNNLLENLARKIGATKSDVLRKSIVLTKVAHDARLKNQRLAIVNHDNSIASEIVGLF